MMSVDEQNEFLDNWDYTRHTALENALCMVIKRIAAKRLSPVEQQDMAREFPILYGNE
jgi:hypothetical protein